MRLGWRRTQTFKRNAHTEASALPGSLPFVTVLDFEVTPAGVFQVKKESLRGSYGAVQTLKETDVQTSSFASPDASTPQVVELQRYD